MLPVWRNIYFETTIATGTTSSHPRTYLNVVVDKQISVETEI
jgi:hypothetical protein